MIRDAVMTTIRVVLIYSDCIFIIFTFLFKSTTTAFIILLAIIIRAKTKSKTHVLGRREHLIRQCLRTVTGCS